MKNLFFAIALALVGVSAQAQVLSVDSCGHLNRSYVVCTISAGLTTSPLAPRYLAIKHFAQQSEIMAATVKQAGDVVVYTARNAANEEFVLEMGPASGNTFAEALFTGPDVSKKKIGMGDNMGLKAKAVRLPNTLATALINDLILLVPPSGPYYQGYGTVTCSIDRSGIDCELTANGKAQALSSEKARSLAAFMRSNVPSEAPLGRFGATVSLHAQRVIREAPPYNSVDNAGLLFFVPETAE